MPRRLRTYTIGLLLAGMLLAAAAPAFATSGDPFLPPDRRGGAEESALRLEFLGTVQVRGEWHGLFRDRLNARLHVLAAGDSIFDGEVTTVNAEAAKIRIAGSELHFGRPEPPLPRAGDSTAARRDPFRALLE